MHFIYACLVHGAGLPCAYILCHGNVWHIIMCFRLNIYLAKAVINTLIEWSTSNLYQVVSDWSMLCKGQTYKHLLE